MKHYFPEVDEQGEIIVDAAGDTVFKQIPPFALTSQEGQAISAEDLDGSMYVANFFFASCPDVCKKMSSQMTRVQERFQDVPDVKLVSFTVNPEHDSVEVLQEYAAMYGADSEKWFFLTGDRQEIYTLAEKGFYLPVQQVAGQQDFIHSEKFLLVDKNRRVRGIYDGTDREDVDRLIIEINVLLDEYSKSK
ncbi:SCO family protein [Pontibacter beigongshangensis]|uniref:SCO family protein n=1 Tax=Pontibacter beigongshangensis TaxID=2574733 RepID=UPI001F50E0AF|nr:SCO family protein [Pontibacter beigongshangensis]